MKSYKIAPLALAGAVFLAGCHLDMWQQPKVKAQSENQFFADGKGSRDPVPGAVEFGKPRTDDAFYTGYANGKLVSEFPVPVDKEFILRGKERYEIVCSHCHGAIGDGKGMIAQRGFEMRRPVGNYHTQRLREMPVGHFFDVINNGFGTMYPQGSRVQPLDRWAIVAYIRALQLSQYAATADLDAASAQRLNATPGTASGPLFTKSSGLASVPQPQIPAGMGLQPNTGAPVDRGIAAEPRPMNPNANHAEGGANH